MTAETIDVVRNYLRKKANMVDCKDEELAEALLAINFCADNMKKSLGFFTLFLKSFIREKGRSLNEEEFTFLLYAKSNLSACLNKQDRMKAVGQAESELYRHQEQDESEECNGRNYKEARNSVSVRESCEAQCQKHESRCNYCGSDNNSSNSSRTGVVCFAGNNRSN